MANINTYKPPLLFSVGDLAEAHLDKGSNGHLYSSRVRLIKPGSIVEVIAIDMLRNIAELPYHVRPVDQALLDALRGAQLELEFWVYPSMLRRLPSKSLTGISTRLLRL